MADITLVSKQRFALVEKSCETDVTLVGKQRFALVEKDFEAEACRVAYSSLKLLEKRFGKANILIWADLENADEDCEVYTPEALEKIECTIQRVSRNIDTALRNQYRPLPFTTVPTTIQGIATAMAGFELYTARSITEENSDVFKAHEDAVTRLDEIKRGSRQLPYPRVKHVPVTDLEKLRATRNAER